MSREPPGVQTSLVAAGAVGVFGVFRGFGPALGYQLIDQARTPQLFPNKTLEIVAQGNGSITGTVS